MAKNIPVEKQILLLGSDNVKAEVKSIFKVITSNSINMLIGIILSFMIPGILNPIEYGYYSLFTLYASYAGFFLLGFCDGFYLIYGGIEYKSLKKKIFQSYFYIMLMYLLTVASMMFLYLYNYELNGNRRMLLYMVLISGLLANINSYFILLNQATSRFNIYAIGNVIEKIVLLFGVILFLLIHSKTVFCLIVIVIIGKLFNLIYYIINSRDIVFVKPCINNEALKGTVNNIKAGFMLMISGIGSMLMTGIGRFGIEKHIGIEALGYYSFMFSVSVLFTQILSAIGVVLYPYMRRYENMDVKYMVHKLDSLIIYGSVIILILYYPARFLLEIFFPGYQQSMEALLCLFPIIICQARRLIIYDMVYKVMRMEKQLVINVLLSVAICYGITQLGFILTPFITMVSLTTYLSILLWNIITVYTYNKTAHVKEKLFGRDIWLCIGYLIIYYLLGYTVAAFILTFVFIGLNYVFDYKKGMNLYRDWKQLIGEKNEKNNHAN